MDSTTARDLGFSGRWEQGQALLTVPGCLICWETFLPQGGSNCAERNQVLFARICSILKIDSSTSKAWNFGIEAFPLCGNCTEDIQHLVLLADRLEAIQKQVEEGKLGVRNKLLRSDHKFISTDLRIIQFRSQVLGGSQQQIFYTRNDGAAIIGGTPNIYINYPPVATYAIGNYSHSVDSTHGLPVATVHEDCSAFVQNPVGSTSTIHQDYLPMLYDKTHHTNFGDAVDVVEVQVGYGQPTDQIDAEFADADSNEISNDQDFNNDDEDFIPETTMFVPTKRNKKAFSKGRSSPVRKRMTWMASQKKFHSGKKMTIKNSSDEHFQRTNKIQSQNRNSSRTAEVLPSVITTMDGRMIYENIEIMKNNEGTYYCGVCEYNKIKANASVTLGRMKIHINGVHLDKYKCQVCQKKYTSQEHLLLHERGQHSIGVTFVPCEICQKPIQNCLYFMDRHLWSHRSRVEKEEAKASGILPAGVLNWMKKRKNNYKCHNCDRDFYKKYQLEKHLKDHLLPNFQLKQQLRLPDFKMVLHGVEITRDDDGLVCGKCNFKVKRHHPISVSVMEKHIMGSSHLDFIKCEICEKSLSLGNISSLKSHMKGHGDDIAKKKKITCSICGKEVIQIDRNSSNKHMWTHLNELEKDEAKTKGLAPFTGRHKCLTCFKRFRRPDLLKRHMETHLPGAKPKDQKCPECDKCFFNQKSVDCHLRNIHNYRTRKIVETLSRRITRKSTKGIYKPKPPRVDSESDSESELSEYDISDSDNDIEEKSDSNSPTKTVKDKSRSTSTPKRKNQSDPDYSDSEVWDRDVWPKPPKKIKVAVVTNNKRTELFVDDVGTEEVETAESRKEEELSTGLVKNIHILRSSTSSQFKTHEQGDRDPDEPSSAFADSRNLRPRRPLKNKEEVILIPTERIRPAGLRQILNRSSLKVAEKEKPLFSFYRSSDSESETDDEFNTSITGLELEHRLGSVEEIENSNAPPAKQPKDNEQGLRLKAVSNAADAKVALHPLPSCLLKAETINLLSDGLMRCVSHSGISKLVSLVPSKFNFKDELEAVPRSSESINDKGQ